MPDILFAILALAVLAVLVLLSVKLAAQATAIRKLPEDLARVLEERHRAMLTDLHGGLAQQSDRLNSRLSDELNQTRETLHRLQLSLAANLGETTEKLNAKIDQRLEQIAGKVNERLEEGFKKTNETFVNVMQRLATIDEAQKKIETLTGSVVSLQELLGDKRSRGAFGEVQLEALVRNVLPNQAFEMQYTLSNGMRVDCVLKLPAP
ncbi:MAG TPA: DNA recombination protein RmuC, partial [Burkholderiales bacterium]|nr:DNA recombination protein RmuC [Burkholderiales bacterium]